MLSFLITHIHSSCILQKEYKVSMSPFIVYPMPINSPSQLIISSCRYNLFYLSNNRIHIREFVFNSPQSFGLLGFKIQVNGADTFSKYQHVLKSPRFPKLGCDFIESDVLIVLGAHSLETFIDEVGLRFVHLVQRMQKLLVQAFIDFLQL